MGGSGKQTKSHVYRAGEEFDKKLASYKQRMKAHTHAIKSTLCNSSAGPYHLPMMCR
jgi:hypothetical protein